MKEERHVQGWQCDSLRIGVRYVRIQAAPLPVHEHSGNVMTNKQRLIYSVLIALGVLAIMLGLSHLQNSGAITEKTFQYIAISVAVLVVILNGIMRRKVKR
ncbi:hypothetical protein ALQ64_04048 [Pseudomonas cannabina]|uniref:Uncharacterized protein n=1 Tax=Pseudomonas cannabina TaxID=86840 RepID=A0A0P9N5K0_PSECA|nr:Uncharacterized protein ALO81_00340 [Pseudomonas cannabina]RMN38925.1 hypothetical protein ALQ64_04048 [Pseudomonas cannabina]SDR06712.1 hypothetical protein SAMN05216597_2171 [Pseudomonas cannabina]